MASFDDVELPWPREGDDPLALGDDWRNNACLNFMGGDPQWFGYAQKTAADVCVDHVMATQRDHDVLVYPIVFNYRQYIERSLKSIIVDARRLLGEPGGAPLTHNLLALWNTARPLLLRAEPRGEQTVIANVGDCLKRFDEMDPTSQSFRYPVDGDGHPTLSGDLYHVNLRQLREVVDRLGGFLDSAGMMLSAYLDMKAEIETEYRYAGY
jgi:hypothetical protein